MVEDKTRPCPSCGGVMRRGVQEETVTFESKSLTYLQPGWRCENGDDGVLEGTDNDYADAALHEVMARAVEAAVEYAKVYPKADRPLPARSLKRMLSDMAASGVWDVESDGEPIEPSQIA